MMDYTVSSKEGTFLWALVQLASGTPVRRASWPKSVFISSQEDIQTIDRFKNDWEICRDIWNPKWN